MGPRQGIDVRKRRTTMKTTNAIQISGSLKLLLAVVIATCALTATVSAQPSFIGKFTLPHEVRWGLATLPAGEYFIRMDPSGPVVVRGAKGDMTVFIKPPIVADSEQGGRYLIVTSQGNERTVRSLNLPEMGKSVIFAPLSKTEREVLAKTHQIDTLPVVTAKK
jgi:hypothetical protein